MTLTLDNIGELIPGAKRDAIVAAVKRQGMPGRKIGRQWYFDADAVRAWLAGEQAQAAHDRNVNLVRVARQQTKLARQRGRAIDQFGPDEE